MVFFSYYQERTHMSELLLTKIVKKIKHTEQEL